MNKYYLVRGEQIKEVVLRETAKSLIDDRAGVRYKKIEGRSWIGSHSGGDSRRSYTTEIYNLDSAEAAKILNKQNEKYFKMKVIEVVTKELRSLSYDDAVRLNDLFELGVTK